MKKILFLSLALVLISTQVVAAVKKNIYKDPKGFSIEMPSGWEAKSMDLSGGDSLSTGVIIVDPSGKVTADNLAFSVTVTPRKEQDDAYFQTYKVKPTDKDLWNMVMEGLEGTMPYWEMLDKNITKVTINGVSGYSANISYGEGAYVKARYYMLFDKKNIYVMSIHAPNKEFTKAINKYRKYVNSFKVVK